MPDRTDSRAALARVQAALGEALSTLGAIETPVVLVDFPNHGNVGDSAIWLGELAWLSSRGLLPTLVCEAQNYDARSVRRCLADGGTIFLHGGGNVGDLWTRHQAFRERILEDFPDRRVVQLPQSIFFRSPEARRSAGEAFGRHRHFTLFARETPSFDLATREFGGDVRLCPDMAFALGPLPRPAAVDELVILARTDQEAAVSRANVHAGTVDWLQDDPSAAIRLERRVRYSSRWPWLRRRLYARLAGERVRRGCRLLGRGRAVVTDRLHAHILCLLMDIPHVLLDNTYGKLSAFYETWTRSSPLATFEHDYARAIARARSLG